MPGSEFDEVATGLARRFKIPHRIARRLLRLYSEDEQDVIRRIEEVGAEDLVHRDFFDAPLEEVDPEEDKLCGRLDAELDARQDIADGTICWLTFGHMALGPQIVCLRCGRSRGSGVRKWLRGCWCLGATKLPLKSTGCVVRPGTPPYIATYNRIIWDYLNQSGEPPPALSERGVAWIA